MTGPDPDPDADPDPIPDPARLALRDFTDADTVRLVNLRYLGPDPDPPLARLADGDRPLTLLETVAALTDPALTDPARPGPFLPPGVHPGELLTAWHGPGWELVNAAFCCPRQPHGSRFNGPDRGAWYACHGADAVDTALAEVGWHLAEELRATGSFVNVSRYREIRAGCTTRLHDLHPLAGGPDPLPVLDPVPARGHRAGRRLAAALRAAGSDGLLYPSVRRPGGACLALFRLPLVQNIRRSATWTLAWTGSPTPTITSP